MKRIKELLLKVVPMEGEDGDLLPSLHTQQDIEKFAELIVKDAIDGLLNAYGPDDCLPQEEIAGFLKEHFGVE